MRKRKLDFDCKNDVLFKLLNDEQLDFLEENMTLAKFAKGEPFFKQGTFVTNVSFLKDGVAKVVKEDENGKKLIIDIATNGTLLGVPNLFNEKTNSYSAIAIEDCTVYNFEKGSFLEIIKQNPQFAYSLLELISKDQLFIFDNFLSHATRQINSRLAKALLYFSEEVYKTKKFKMNFSRQDLAELTGVTKETITRTLAEFDEQKLVSVKAKEIEILNTKGLLTKTLEE